MSNASTPEHASVTLRQAFTEFLQSVRSNNRLTYERYVREYVESVGEDQSTGSLSGPRVEGYAETHIKTTDPLASARVSALKAWFQYLKKHDYTPQNFGTVIRLRRSGRSRGKVSAVSSGAVPLDVTADGLGAMKAELETLEGEAPKLIEAIAAAREDKDFRENAPLDAAREALAQNEARRRRLEDEIRRARIVSDRGGDRAVLGSSVTITRVDNGQKATYRLVGIREANVREGKISVESPVGHGLLGRAVGEEATVSTPTGEVLFRVDNIDASDG